MVGRNRTCCCGGNCLSSVDIALSGVDASLCTGGCADVPTLNLSYSHNALNVDGTYNVAFLQENLGTTCVYDDDSISATACYTYDEHDDDTCTSVVNTVDANLIDILVTYDHTNSRVTQVFVQVNAGPFVVEIFQYNYSGGTSYDYGDAIPNDKTCPASTSISTASDGGTATITVP